MVWRVYTEKYGIHAVEAQKILKDLKENLLISSLNDVRVLNRYDVEGVDKDIFEMSCASVLSEPQVDNIYFEIPEYSGRIFASEYLPGQYDQRADSASQCIQLLSCGERPAVRTAKIYILSGEISDSDFDRIKKYLINPVECREACLEERTTLVENYEIPTEVAVIDDFITMSDQQLSGLISKYSLAMDEADIIFCRDYFRTENRNPTMTEMRLIDSYWSDHCRHTTFSTAIQNAYIDEKIIYEAFKSYLEKREFVYQGRKKPVTLMDIATMGAKYLKKKGCLGAIDESEEINACSIKIKVETSGGTEDWLLMFKNETHNHPTEIEPFGGAATCLGGAIRDPLSGRTYVYQAMRVTGAADVTLGVDKTMAGKLPQSKISLGAASGYSSYGNQIGLATGGVYEIYHPNYVAKRLEIGAVVGAAPAENVRRETPSDGDVIILLGGRTGRDGCGGATGSSKAHSVESITTCGAEVQKGNPPEERKIQRLFRNKEVTSLIKRCNDFGAGGVSVAIGELSDGLVVDLSKVPKKYEGLDGTELAISESQERMAVVISSDDVDKFISLANSENIEATPVARVTEEKRLKMLWNDKTIVDISREFLNSNGAPKNTDIAIPKVNKTDLYKGLSDTIDTSDLADSIYKYLGNLNICSQKGLVERFDSTVGAATVVMPFGGKYQLSPSQYMAAKIPVMDKETSTVSVMAYGFNPYVCEKSPFHGGICSIVESVSKIVASGVSFRDAWLTLQEYFERTSGDPLRWGKPMAALLGAFKAQCELEIAAIGGKDSMSGTFEKIDVPPTIVSFAIAPFDARNIVTGEFKKAGSKIFMLLPKYDSDGVVDFEDLKNLFDYVHTLAKGNKILSCRAIGFGGAFEEVFKGAIGNKLGVDFVTSDVKSLFVNCYGGFIVETSEDVRGKLIAYTTDKGVFSLMGVAMNIEKMLEEWEKPLEKVFPVNTAEQTARKDEKIIPYEYTDKSPSKCKTSFVKPKIIIPVFPGTNCEYDTKKAFDRAGGNGEIFVFRNITPAFVEQSIDELANHISTSQILMIPGGFSGGDEPDGSGKFITSVMRNPKIAEAINDLLYNRDGLVLGICNGFQALIKLGLLPYGEIKAKMLPTDPTLTFNSVGRHQSMMVNTRIASVKSPWLSSVNVGDIHTVAISHGEGRFCVNAETMERLVQNGQIATQYVDDKGQPTMNIRYNPNASDYAIEGITSPDGRVFGKMGHSERRGDFVSLNVPGNKDQKIFESGVKYFS
ncbi:MAG: phosphoribosylformylglycinamidine synthase [Clostridia bacterium]|nr:phosphoribosylformylglycinamidine synthase [Clostridia bacterium]